VVATPRLPKADVVITTSPQFFNGLAGYFVGRLKRIPWVLEIRDLWPESILTVGAVRNRIVIRLLSWLEMFAYRKADHIVPNTDAFRRYMIEKGVPAEKITVVKNGADLERYVPAARDPALARELGLEGKFVAAYFGTHGMAHHLETVLEAAERLRDEPGILFLLVGDGAQRARLVEQKDAMGLTNIIMLGQQPKERMPALWASADVSLVLLKRSDLFKTVIPSKIFEAMAMERPLILGVEGEAKALVEEAGAGVCIQPESDAELADAVLALARDPERTGALGQRGRRFVTEFYSRAVMAKRFEATLAGVVAAYAGAEPAADVDG
jgi:glycosyltransferase involved in cell wall biosynthesis